jgi:predicted outer membrane repeat protein
MLCAAVIGLFLFPARWATVTLAADTWTVNTCNLGVADRENKRGSLDKMIDLAASGDTVRFTVDCTGGTMIKLTSALSIDKDLTVDGNGKQVEISGENKTTVFSALNRNVTLKGLTIVRGGQPRDRVGDSPAIDYVGDTQVLQIIDCIVRDSIGGAVRADGNVQVRYSTFRNNKAEKRYGGALELKSGTADVQNSRFEGNSALWGGGAIFADTRFNLTNSTLLSNTTELGGAIYVAGSGIADITRSTFTLNRAAGNTIGYGGGLEVSGGRATVTNSTFSANTAKTYGGGIYASTDATVSVIYTDAEYGPHRRRHLYQDRRYASHRHQHDRRRQYRRRGRPGPRCLRYSHARRDQPDRQAGWQCRLQ